MKRPLFVTAAGWAAGIGAGERFSAEWWSWAAASLLVLAAGWGIHHYRRRFLAFTLAASACFAGAAQFAWVDGHNVSRLAEAPGEAVAWGRIASAPEVDGDRFRAEVAVDRLVTGQGSVPMAGERILLRIRLDHPREKQAAAETERGLGVIVPVQLERADPARNPGAFDYRRFLQRQGIHWIGEGKEWDSLVPASPPEGFPRYADRLRAFLGERIERMFPAETAGLMRGMLLGERKEVPADIEEEFRAMGLVHLLAISGLNVGIFVACIFGGLTLMGMTREKAAVAALAAIPVFVAVTGAEAPVMRAGVMAMLGLTAVLLRKWGDGVSFLGFAALLLFWWNPYSLFDAGFQLSFLITGALLTVTGPLSRILPFPWRFLNQTVAVTLTAHLASFPLLLFHFHTVSWLSLAANLAVVPWISVIVVPLGYASLLLSLLHVGAAWLPATLSAAMLDVLVSLLGLAAEWRGAEQSWAPPPGWWYLAYAAGAGYLLWSWTGGPVRASRHRAASTAFVAGCILFAALQPGLFRANELTVTFLDVGQGDCAVIETPGGQVILVDGGGNLPFPRERWQQPREEYDVGERVLVPFLRSRGIRRVDWMVMTHGDADHIGGLSAVVRRFPVGRVIRNPHPPGTAMERELMGRLRADRVPIHLPPVGSPRSLEPGITWQFLHPDGTGTPPAKEVSEGTNDDSVVFLLQAAGRRLLFTGDAGEPAEKTMLKDWELPPVDLLKVAHHGSRTSTGADWLAAVHPRDAVISAGRENRFGHPAPEVLDRLQAGGSRIWRTDRQGAVTLTLSPGRWQMEPTLNEGH